jgi:hypothetical protein
MDGASGGRCVAEGKKIIEVTDEEFEYLIKLRAELLRRQAAGGSVPTPRELPPEQQRGRDFAMGAVAGVAAYWLYKELMDDDEEGPSEAAPAKTKPQAKRKGGGGK